MKPGDVLFYKGTSPISRVIQWVTGSPYTHVALYIGDGTIIEADRFIRSRERKLTFEDHYEVFAFEGITASQRMALVSNAKVLTGYQYDWGQIVRIFLRMVFRRPSNMFQFKNALICSDIIDIPAYVSDIPRRIGLEVGEVSPAELFEVYDLRKLA